jgi:hypothetical protein
MVNVAEDIERLVTATIKLYMVCEKKGKVANGSLDLTKEELVELMKQDIDLCKQRGALKNSINKALGLTPMEVKRYGSD